MAEKDVGGKYCYDWPRPAVAADVCALSRDDEGRWRVLLIRRANEPYAGHWALPGGFLDVGREDLETCARRELMEETAIAAPSSLRLLGVWSDPARDPRGHVISAVWLALFDWPPPRPRAGDDAAHARWLAVDERIPLAFDHRQIVDAALARAGAEKISSPSKESPRPRRQKG